MTHGESEYRFDWHCRLIPKLHANYSFLGDYNYITPRRATYVQLHATTTRGTATCPNRENCSLSDHENDLNARRLDTAACHSTQSIILSTWVREIILARCGTLTPTFPSIFSKQSRAFSTIWQTVSHKTISVTLSFSMTISIGALCYCGGVQYHSSTSIMRLFLSISPPFNLPSYNYYS